MELAYNWRWTCPMLAD